VNLRVHFSPEGHTVATVDSGGHATLRDVFTGQWNKSQPVRFDRIRELAFSPDGLILAGGTLDSTIILWDRKSLQVRAELRAHDRPVNALAFSPDGRLLASASGDVTLILWSITAGNPLSCRTRLSSSIVSMAFSPDGARLATSHIDGEVRIRAVTAPETSALVGRFTLPSQALAFSHDGRTLVAAATGSSQIDGRTLVSGGNDRTVRLWDVSKLTSMRGRNGDRADNRGTRDGKSP
jgi:WD40 repeat protein